jgi:hypothetical protein
MEGIEVERLETEGVTKLYFVYKALPMKHVGSQCNLLTITLESKKSCTIVH